MVVDSGFSDIKCIWGMLVSPNTTTNFTGTLNRSSNSHPNRNLNRCTGTEDPIANKILRENDGSTGAESALWPDHSKVAILTSKYMME